MTRLYLPFFEAQTPLPIIGDTHHYMCNVLRLREKDRITIFNAQMGNWEACIRHVGKKELIIEPEQQIMPPTLTSPVALAFAILKRDALSWMLEKATELGCSDFYPILSKRTQNLPFHEERALKITIDAAQQCERFDIPNFHPLSSLSDFLKQHQNLKWYAALERQDDIAPLGSCQSAKGYIIGPEGGWTDDEHQQLRAHVTPVSLGNCILRAETAALMCLSHHIFLITP